MTSPQDGGQRAAGTVETLGRFLQSFLSDGPDAAMAYVHPDVVADEPSALPYGGIYRGRDAFADLMRRMAETVDIQVREHEFFADGDTIVGRFDATFTARDTGTTVEMPMIGVYTFTDGLISRTDMYYKDTSAWIAQSTTRSAVGG